MSIKAIIRLIRNRQLLPALQTSALYKPYYRLVFITAAKSGGLLDRLSTGSATFDSIANDYCRDAKAREALQAWFQLGVNLGLLSFVNDRFEPKGLMRKLARPENDAALALAQEVATLHHELVFETPTKLLDGQLFALDDQDGELTARSSRAFEAFLTTMIDRIFPPSGPIKLLEVGCGSAWYIRYAAERNASLTALGTELQPDVAARASANIIEWKLDERVKIETGDIRTKAPAREFDIVTLYNNIYYFPVEERASLLGHLGGFIKPGGMLLLATGCQGGSPAMDVLNLWGAATRTGGRLPGVAELRQQLADAGLKDIAAFRLVPGDSYYVFRAIRP